MITKKEWIQTEEAIGKALMENEFTLADVGKYKKVVHPNLTLIVDISAQPPEKGKVPVFFINNDKRRVDEDFEGNLAATNMIVMKASSSIHNKPKPEDTTAKPTEKPEQEITPIPKTEKKIYTWDLIKEKVTGFLLIDGFKETTPGMLTKSVENDPDLTTVVDMRTQPKTGANIAVRFVDKELVASVKDFENNLEKARATVQMGIDAVLHGKEVKPEPKKSKPKTIDKPDIKPITEKEKPKPEEKPSTNLPVQYEGKTDAEIDRKIEQAKTKRFLENRGDSYKVRGTERPDAHAIQHAANDAGINIELIEATQTSTFCHVVVRGHMGNQYVDAVVHHEFDVEHKLKIMEIAAKNPEIISHYDGINPIIDANAMITVQEYGKTKSINAQYYIVHAVLSQQKFSIRDARTKAASIAEAMLLNREYQGPEEKASEYDERKTVQNSINTKVIK